MDRSENSAVQYFGNDEILFRGASLAVIGALFLVAISQREVNAITITMEYTDEGSPTPHPENPSWDPAGTILKAHFTRAKQIWEQLLPGPSEFEFDFHWDDDIDDPDTPGITLGLATQVGVDTFIEINPLAPWYADQFPANDDEFNLVGTQYLVGGLTAVQKDQYFPFAPPPPDALETGYFRPGNSTEIGPGGYDSQTGFDLLTVVVHEIGHILGIDKRNPPGVSTPILYPILPEHLGGASGAFVLGGDGGHLAGNETTPGYLMCHSCGTAGGRYYPSATDVLVIAAENEISDVSLQRIGRISSGNWTTANAWIGGDVPTPTKDVYIANGQSVTLNVDAGMRDLYVKGGSSLAVDDRILSSGGILDFKDSSFISTTPGGIIYANKIVRGATDLAASAGSTVMFNSYEGGSGTTASFNARVVIGTGTGAGHSFDPTTITTWNFAGGLDVGSFGRTADFIVDNGMTVTSSEGKLGTGSLTDSSGLVSVTGSDMSTGALSKWTVSGPLTVASGQMIVTQDAEVFSASGFVGTANGEGSVQVFTSGLWNVSNDLTIGPNSPGATGRGFVTIRNDGDLWVDGNVVVRGSVAAKSELVIASGGEMRVDGNVTVAPNGVVGYYNSTKAHAGVLGAENFENLGGNDTSVGGITRFYDTATAGNAKFINRPGTTAFAVAGQTQFYNNSTAGNDINGHAQFDNYASNSTYSSGATRFFDFASAGRATFYNHTVGGFASFAIVEFNGDSTGANGTFINLPGVSGQSLGGAFVFKNRSKAGYATYTSQGEGGTVAFYHNSSAEHGTFTTADNVGGNSVINFYDDTTADHGTFSMGANTNLNFLVRSTAADATITIRPAGYVGFSGEYNFAYNATTSAGDATIELQGASTPYTNGGHAGFSTWSTAGDAKITAQGGTVLYGGGGTISFDYVGHAGNATLIANGGSGGGGGGEIYFRRGATGDNAEIIVNAGGVANFSGNIGYGGTSVGSIEGAGTFALNGSELRTGGRNTDTTVSGPIIDALGTNPNGQLTKNGTGTLTLAGANTYTGLTTINGGTLSVTGSLAGGAVVNNGGKLNGTGAIAGGVAVNSGGTFDPGLSPGTLTVGGLQLNAGGHLRFELGAVRDHIVLTGGGNVALAGILDLSLLAGFAPNLNETFPLFEGAVGTISGAFSAINSPIFNGHKLNVVYGVNAVTLHVIDAVLPPGDYNGNGVVDGADYVVWRKGLGTTYNQTHYDLWRAHFGELAPAGLGAGSQVPEPHSFTALLLSLLALTGRRRERVR